MITKRANAKSSMTVEAIEQIKRRIVSGALHPGDRLPREADLAADLGVSRNSLREAVSALSLVRILDVRQGDGTYVTSLTPQVLLEALSFVVDFRRDDSLLQFLEIRRILEPAATARAAMRITPAEIAELRTLTSAVKDFLAPDRRTESTSVEALVAQDIQFHKLLASFSGNEVLASLIDSISVPTMRARAWRILIQEEAVQRIVDEHSSIIDALAMGQPDLASARALVHIAGTEEWVGRVH